MTMLLADVPESVIGRARRAMPGLKRDGMVTDALALATAVHELPGGRDAFALLREIVNIIARHTEDGECDHAKLTKDVSEEVSHLVALLQARSRASAIRYASVTRI